MCAAHTQDGIGAFPGPFIAGHSKPCGRDLFDATLHCAASDGQSSALEPVIAHPVAVSEQVTDFLPRLRTHRQRGRAMAWRGTANAICWSQRPQEARRSRRNICSHP